MFVLAVFTCFMTITTRLSLLASSQVDPSLKSTLKMHTLRRTPLHSYKLLDQSTDTKSKSFAGGVVDETENASEGLQAVPLAVFEGDMLVPSFPTDDENNSQKGAAWFHVRLWKKGPSGMYEVAMTMPKSAVMRKRLKWVCGYISRGANILFRPKTDADVVWAQVTENRNKECHSHLGAPSNYRGASRINLSEERCTTLHLVLHEVLHLLGFMHEHQRTEKDKVFVNNTMPALSKMGEHTPFDPLSVMNYRLDLTGPYKNSSWNKFSKDRRSFMSTCDWNLLLRLYPGPNKPPECKVDQIANVLRPTKKLVLRFGYKKAEDLCHLGNESFFDEQECVIPGNKKYPDLKLEFFDSNAMSLTGKNWKKLCRRVMNRQRKQRSNKIAWNEKDISSKLDSVKPTSSFTQSDHLAASQKLFPHLLKKRTYCSRLMSRNTSVISHDQCVLACLSGCEKYAIEKPLLQCLHEDYSPCFEWSEKLSSSLTPASFYLPFFLYTVVYVLLS